MSMDACEATPSNFAFTGKKRFAGELVALRSKPKSLAVP
jgi:hypothetical protein